MMESAMRPLPTLPGYVEESLVNDYVNLNKEIILRQLPEGQPTQPQEVAAADDAVADGPDGQPCAFRRSASALMHQQKGIVLERGGAATMHGPDRGVSRSATW